MRTKTCGLALAATLALLFGGAREVSAGFVTATLEATPSTINEGGATTFSLSVYDTPFPYGMNTGFYGEWFTGGPSSIYYVMARLDAGDGQSTYMNMNNYYGTQSAHGTTSVGYSLPGNYIATVSGSVGTSDPYYWSWSGGGLSYWSTVTNISASTQVQVNNVAPRITGLTWTPEVQAGTAFSFSAAATDPGLPGGEKLTFAWDLNNSGQYTNFVTTGGTTGGGTYQFDTAGTYTVGVRVTDGFGGVTYGNFNVQVDPDVSAVPEPASLTMLGMGALTLAGYAWRRRKKAATATN